MSSNEWMSNALSCKNCRHYHYACKCEKFESNDPEGFKYIMEDDNEEVSDVPTLEQRR